MNSAEQSRARVFTNCINITFATSMLRAPQRNLPNEIAMSDRYDDYSKSQEINSHEIFGNGRTRKNEHAVRFWTWAYQGAQP